MCIKSTRALTAFERFMARLDNHWALKGGSFLQLRTEKARKTQNVDLLLKKNLDEQESGSCKIEILVKAV
jgi:hypothetical protein